MTPQEYAQTVFALQRAEHEYRAGSPIMSDQDFDAAVLQLQEFERQHPYMVLPGSPTKRVGSDLTEGFKKVKHPKPMLSLDNTFSMEELMRRLESVQLEVGGVASFSIEPKIDGIALALQYKHGMLHRALTRGDGVQGDDVTANAMTIRDIPLVIVTDVEFVEIRGEVCMHFDDFKEYNELRVASGLEAAANPRNLTAGTMKLLDPSECAKRKLRFYAYHISVYQNGTNKVPLADQSQVLNLLNQTFKFRPMGAVQIANGTTEVLEAVERFEATKSQLPYPVDGAVIKLHSIDDRRKFQDGTKSPKWAWAYKYAAETAFTVLKAITIQVGRTGVLTPVAELEPVELAGTTVSRASLHNDEQINRLDVRPGDQVEIHKAGEIIPQVLRRVSNVTEDRPAFVMPETCPSCGGKVIKASNLEESEAIASVCTNTWKCPEQIMGRLLHWCQKSAMDIQDIGPQVIHAMFTYLDVMLPHHLYTLDVESLEKLDLIGKVKAAKLVRQIEKSKTAGLERVLVGLGIPRIGTTLCRRLAMAAENMTDLGLMPEATLLKVNGMTQTLVETLRSWFQGPRTQELISNLERVGVSMASNTYNPKIAGGPFGGMRVVITGELASMDREAFVKVVEENGGRVTGSVSGKTNLVVIGVNPGGNKLKGAEKHGVKCIQEPEFLEMLRSGDCAS